MKIFLNEHELEDAVSTYVKSLGITLPTIIDIELKAGRGSNGHTASVAFGEGEAEASQELSDDLLGESVDPDSSLFQTPQDA